MWYNGITVVADRPKRQYREAPLVGAGVPVYVAVSHYQRCWLLGNCYQPSVTPDTSEPTSGAFCVSGGGDHGP